MGAAAEDDRVDELAVLVDQVPRGLASGARPAPPMDTTPSPGWSRSRPASVAMSRVARRALPAAEVSVPEHTTFGDRPPDPGELKLRLAGHGLLGGLPDQHVLMQTASAQVHGNV
jgi:hypothetical protein